jgi:ribosomal protein L31
MKQAYKMMSSKIIVNDLNGFISDKPETSEEKDRFFTGRTSCTNSKENLAKFRPRFSNIDCS